MKIMVVGGGGREHAIIKKLKENKTVTEIFAAPGNGGIAKDATCVDIGAKEIDKIQKPQNIVVELYKIVRVDDDNKGFEYENVNLSSVAPAKSAVLPSLE